MNSNSVRKNSKPTYLLVLDLPEMMEAYERVGDDKGNGLKIPDAAFFKERQQRLATKLQETVPECYVETIEANKLTNQIVASLHKLLAATPEAVVISTVPSVAWKTSGICARINRLVDPKGNSFGVGPRPGNPSIHSQFLEIKELSSRRPVILVEDGSFTGGTMIKMIEICNELHIEIKCLVIGFLFASAKEAILKVFHREEDIHYWREGNFFDWMPDHDFYPFVPNAGKVIGFSYNANQIVRHMPVRLHNGLSLCKPYILPYGNPVEWASIPQDQAKKFSTFCIHEARDIFWEMFRLNGRHITLEDIVSTNPCVGLPVPANDMREFPHIKAEVRQILLDHEHAVEFLHP